jgi:drug/metabolite transporter (DMT)-like permease
MTEAAGTNDPARWSSLITTLDGAATSEVVMRQSFRIPKTRRWGLILAAVTAAVSGFAVFINGYGVRAWSAAGASSAAYTTSKNLLAALFLGGIAYAVARRSPGTLRPQTASQWRRLGFIGVIGGGVPFLLFFEGLSRASSAQAAFIHKTLLVWVALLAVPFLAERLSALHVGAIGLLVAGQAYLTGVSGLRFGTGEAMILAATLMWAVEVIVAKRLLADVPAPTVAVARMGIGAVVLIGWTAVTGGFASLAALDATQWGWALVTGMVLTAYVATWYGALARAHAVDVTAVLVFGAVITAMLDTGVRGVPLPSTAGLVMVSLGAALAAAAGARAARQKA